MLPEKYNWSMKFDKATQKLLFHGGDEAFYQIHNLDKRSKGLPIDEVYEHSYCRHLYGIWEKVQQANKSVLMIREFDKIAWQVLAIWEFPFVRFECRRFWSQDEFDQDFDMVRLNTVSFRQTQQTYFDAVVVQRSPQGYILTTISGKLSAYLNIHAGDNADLLLNYMYHSKSMKMLDVCLLEYKILRHLDIFNKNNRTHYMMLVLCPLAAGSDQVYIGIHLLSRQLFYELQSKVENATEREAEFSNIGAAVFCKKQDGVYTIISANPMYQKLLKNTDDQDLLSDNLLNPCLQSKSTTTKTLTIDGELFFFVAEPTFDQEQVYLFAIKDNQAKQGLEAIFCKLTPRQREIAELLVVGYPSRYIAHTLNIAEGTVKRQIYNVYQKLQINSRVELMRLLIFPKK